MTDSADLMTTRALARLLGVHPKQVYRLLERGLPALRVGDEWRFERERVLEWAGATPAARGRALPSASEGPPPLLAANGDCAVELLLAALRAGPGPLLGFVQADHTQAATLLGQGRVLIAGQHGSEVSAATLPRCARLHLVTRQVGLVTRRGSRLRGVSALVGKRVASRPPTAGVRRQLDQSLALAGIEPERAYRHATECACHRDVVLAVSAGAADVGIATDAWARAANLPFQALHSEPYELVIPVQELGNPRVVALCEVAQGPAWRKQLRDDFGYDVGRTGELRVGDR
jgi:putative molybdopterin biosynthesis protein